MMLEQLSPIIHMWPIANNGQHKLNTALIALEILEPENTKLKKDMLPPKRSRLYASVQQVYGPLHVPPAKSINL